MTVPRLLRHPGIALPLLGTAALAAVSVLSPLLLAEEAVRGEISAARQGPSAEHLLGTDELGRDILARTLVASELTLRLALITTVLGAVAGIPLAAVASVGPRPVRRLATQVIHATLAIPGILVALFVIAVTGPGMTGTVVAMILTLAPAFARVLSTSAVSVITSDYVAAARMAGLPRLRLFRRHVLPNIADPLIVTASLAASEALVTLAALSFLGLGVQPPDTDWGRLLTEGLSRVYTTPAAAVAPAVLILVAGVVFALAGDALAALMNPVTKAQLSGPRTGPRGASAADGAREGAVTAVHPESDGHPEVLRVRGLTVVDRGRPHVPLVSGVDLTVGEEEIVGLVGESGSGKTATVTAASRLLPPGLETRARTVEFDGRDLTAGRDEDRSALGLGMPVVFQDPMTALNPALRIGSQMTEAARTHRAATRAGGRTRAVERLRAVRIHDPEDVVRRFPHELSGGMRQRVTIATALMGTPRLIIADEVTTALDVSVQAGILRLLKENSTRWGTAVLFISHDLSLVAQICSRVVVMYAGRVVEAGPTERVLGDPLHPYTAALLACVPRLDMPRDRPLRTLPGSMPAPGDLPAGCAFAPRCPATVNRCHAERPVLRPVSDRHQAACWLAPEPGHAQSSEHAVTP